MIQTEGCSGIIHNSQNVETPKCLPTNEWIKKMRYILIQYYNHHTVLDNIIIIQSYNMTRVNKFYEFRVQKKILWIYGTEKFFTLQNIPLTIYYGTWNHSISDCLLWKLSELLKSPFS